MKTYVSDYYQVTPMEDGRIKIRITRLYGTDTVIKYDPTDKKTPWTVNKGLWSVFDSQDITGLELTKYELDTLHDALTAVGKQDLMDNEIVFVGEK